VKRLCERKIYAKNLKETLANFALKF